MTPEEYIAYKKANYAFIEKHLSADLLEFDKRDADGNGGEILRAIYHSPALKRAKEIDEYMMEFFRLVREEQLKRGEDIYDSL